MGILDVAAAEAGRAGERLRARGMEWRGLGGRIGTERRGEVEVTRRVFRVEGSEERLRHPGLGPCTREREAVRKIESRPLVQTVAGASRQRARTTAKERCDY